MSEIELITNDSNKGRVVLDRIANGLQKCISFDFSVAFINQSGISMLKQDLLDLKQKSIKGRLVTSTYLNFNTPETFEELMKFDNIEVRVFEGEGFHSKGYLFNNKNSMVGLIGSSNLTQTALKTNQEWNLCFDDSIDSDIALDVIMQFENQWDNSVPLTDQWLDEYRNNWKPAKKEPTYEVRKSHKIIPNKMQVEALAGLEKIRNDNLDKALLISATGTGKTYLSAFDVQAVRPKRMLFVVHRENIAVNAKETFEKVISDKRFGMYTGSRKDDTPYLFATIQTIGREHYYSRFDKDYFDYIIIDEVHKAGASQYLSLINYFKPKFMLGMTATPERTDGFDIFKLFDHNIAYEIRLSQAMEYNLVCPFHYFGISDLIVDGEKLDDNTNFNLLTSADRVDHIISNIETYGYQGDKVRGLVFTSRVEEAILLSEMFNQSGYRTVALSGKDDEYRREVAIERLEQEEGPGALDYIFTVDIFNEGIDIPRVNQVVMLRPTQSAIIFVQQLGRGLRKLPSKEYVVVLDFIANYSNNFMIPLALSGSRSYNKDMLRKTIITSKAFIPGCSTVSFDRISKTEIFKSIDQANFNSVKVIKDEYVALKNKLGRIPTLMDFKKHDSIDVLRIFENKSLGSYHTFLKKYEREYNIELNEVQENMLTFVSSKLANGKRDNELRILKGLIQRYGHGSISEFEISPLLTNNTAKQLMNDFCINVNSVKTFDKAVFIKESGGNYEISESFREELRNIDFVRILEEVVDFALNLAEVQYSNKYADTDFVLYEKYSYEDVCRLLDWDNNLVSLNIGGYKYDSGTNTLPVFINYNKEDDISDTTNYEDHFINRKIIKAMSKSNRDVHSKDIETIYNSETADTKINLFVRKNKDDKTSKEFYYLGRIRPIDKPNQFIMKNTNASAVEITYELDTQVREDIYEYIVENS